MSRTQTPGEVPTDRRSRVLSGGFQRRFPYFVVLKQPHEGFTTKAPESIRGIRNFLVLAKLLGTIEPELVEGLARSLAEALTLAKTYESKPPGFWRTELHQFRSRDLRRGLVFISSLLEAFGQELTPEKRRA